MFKFLKEFWDSMNGRFTEKQKCTCGKYTEDQYCPSEMKITHLGFGLWKIERRPSEMILCGKFWNTLKEVGRLQKRLQVEPDTKPE